MTTVHTVTVHQGDCLDVLPTLPSESVSAVVTDPPYGLRFMGATWDHGVPGVPFWEAVLRVCKPGVHLLAFGGTRTYHRLACAIEDAGWEVRDCLMWVYGNGFPKSLDVSKAIDKAAGAEREVVGPSPFAARKPNGSAGVVSVGLSAEPGCNITAPATPEAAQWQGWGTALKPAWEPIILARKPLAGTVAQNVLANGAGALNIDACRVPVDDGDRAVLDARSGGQVASAKWQGPGVARQIGELFASHPSGRWPANLLHDGSPEVTALFPETGGERPERVGPKGGNGGSMGAFAGSTAGAIGVWPADSGGSAARFFYVPKADRSDRGEGNRHPTVKPQDLIRYLITLVTPPGGTVLDPFAGSGTTGVVCCRQSRPCVLIEREAEWCDVILHRLRHVGQVDIPGLETDEVLR